MARLRHAVAMRMLPRNPADNMALPRIRRREMTALSEEEIGKLLAAAEGTPVAVPLLCLVTLGVRRGELLGLTWPDVDFEQGQVSVRRTLEESSAGVILKEPKTARATRTLALPRSPPRRFAKHRSVQLEMRLRLGPGFNAAELVFPGADGEPWWSSNFARACRRVFDDAGLFRSRLHDLRHTHATMLLRPGVHPKVVSERLGHANVVDDSRHLLARDAAHAGGGRRQDRRGAGCGAGRLMTDRTDRTDCPAFELLAVAYHESGHAVGAVLVSPGLVVETVTIVPDGDYLGRVTYEDWRENLVPDEDDEDSGEICEHERLYRHAGDIVSALGAVAEGMLRHGRADQPVMAGTGVDQANVHANAEAVLEDDIFRKAGFYHGPRGLDIDAALALIRPPPPLLARRGPRRRSPHAREDAGRLRGGGAGA